MNNPYDNFFEDIDQTITDHFGKIPPIHFKIIGFTALTLAGLPDRGTKDIDIMEADVLIGSKGAKIANLISKEFGKKSPGLYKHGMYVDMVHQSVARFPPKPVFEPYKNFNRIHLSLLDPTDVCVTKVFSYFKSRVRRANDRHDIINCLNKKLIVCKHFVRRMEEALSHHEVHAEAPDIYPQIIRFINEEIIPNYGGSNITMNYEIPNWMSNM